MGDKKFFLETDFATVAVSVKATHTLMLLYLTPPPLQHAHNHQFGSSEERPVKQKVYEMLQTSDPAGLLLTLVLTLFLLLFLRAVGGLWGAPNGKTSTARQVCRLSECVFYAIRCVGKF